MTREIKFRAWDKEDKTMLDIISLDFVRDGHFWLEDSRRLMFEPEHVELMQFTGLKDKNGKEIYEGDIVREVVYSPRLGEDIVSIYKIQCISYECLLIDEHGRERNDISNGECFSDVCYMEVIGNIYEHGDLLNGK